MFNGSMWNFRLASLYEDEQRYEDAIEFCEMIKKEKPSYESTANSIIERLKNKQRKYL